ncbi:MAG: hypothetical protein K5874_07295 [Bacteroidaceae bacterium]|nr:hypothetical protein [Bacteroidaceae bacterium]
MRKKNYYLFATAMLLSSCFISCDKDDSVSPDNGDDVEFVHSVNIGDNTYISVLKDLNVGEVNTNDAQIHANGAFTYVYKNKVYVTDTEHLYKYKVSEGRLVQEGSTLLFPAGAKAVFVTFLSDTKAYVSCLGLGKIWIINPSTMQKTDEIDLSEYALGKEESDNNPEPGASIIRDGILYVALTQLKSSSIPHQGAHVALIDTKTDKPIKTISDNRATMVSCMTPTGDPFVDEKGDIYFYSIAMFGYISGLNEGFLRIKNGEQEFDESYYFPIATKTLQDVPGGKASYVYNKVYAGNGKVYAYLNIPGASSNPPDYVNDKSMQAFEIDVYNKTLKKMAFPATTGWAASICKDEDNIVWGMATEEGTGYYIYNTKDLSYNNMILSTVGAPYMINSLK